MEDRQTLSFHPTLETVFGFTKKSLKKTSKKHHNFPRSFTESNFIKPVRAIRTPFRNSEIMTARGFGKRDGSDLEIESKFLP
jgi:hypothetical protein